MEHRSQQYSSGSSSSSFAETLFGPKDSGSSSSGLFGSVFGPSSMASGLGKDSAHFRYTGSTKKEDFGTPKHSTKGCKTQRSNERNHLVYQTETAEPSYLSSSIYYGGQEVYPPTTHNHFSHRTFKKGGGDEDPNGSSASRGNWWQGSLYY